MWPRRIGLIRAAVLGAFIAVMSTISSMGALAQPANPLVQGSRPPAEAAAPAEPGTFARLKATPRSIQANVHRSMNNRLTEIRDQGTATALYVGLLLAFLYGAFHAAGPGHGKAVVVSYFLARNARVLRGFLMGAQIAFTHVLSAIVIILLAHFVLTGIYGAQLAEAREIKLASYGLIVAIGAFMLLQKVTGWFKHSHDHDHDHGHGHGHHHHDHEHADHLDLHQRRGRAQTALLAFVVGLVPCSGSIIILVYALANGILIQGLIMTLFIAMGMTITMACVGMIAIVARDRVLRLMDDTGTACKFIRNGFEILGPFVIIAVGVLLLAGV